MSQPTDRFDDEQAKAILARAIELDARAPSTSVDELRAIAADVGISPAALDAALREHALPAIDGLSLARARRRATAVAAIGLPIGLGLGAFLVGGTLASGLVALGVRAGAFAASGAILLALGRSATGAGFRARNALLWGGVLAGSAAVLTLAGESSGIAVALAWALRDWLASTILGSAAVVAVRRAKSPAPPMAAPPADAADRAAKPAWKRLIVRVLDRLARPLRWQSHRQLRSSAG